MLRRLILAGTVSAAGLGGMFLMSPVAHAQAAGSVCVTANATVAGQNLVDQSQCQSLPSAPSPTLP